MPEWVDSLANWASQVHLHYVVPVIVFAVVVGLFLWTLVPFRRRIAEREKEIDGALACLGGKEPEDVRRRQIEEYFEANLAEDAVLRHHWREFKESFVQVDGVPRNTIDAAHFFNPDDIVDGGLGTEFNRHAPGMFTAAGIVGTFFGIALGLLQATVKLQGNPDTQKVTEATRALLVPVGPAFMASFVAVLLAVVFLFVERRLVRKLKSKLLDLQILLDALYQRAKPEDYFEEHLKKLPHLLRELREHSEEQTTQLKKAVTDLTPTLETALQRMVEQQSREMQETNRLLIAQIAQSVSQNLQPVSTDLKQAVSEMKRQQSESTAGAIREMVDRFSDTLASGAQSQVDELAKALGNTAALLEAQRESLQEYVIRMGEQMTRQADLLEQQLGKLAEESRRNQRDSIEGLRRFLEEVTGSVSTVQERSLQQAMGSLDRAGQDLQALVKEVSEQIAQLVTCLNTSAVESSEHLALRQEEAVTRLADHLASFQSSLQSALEAMLDKLQTSTQGNLKVVAGSLTEASQAAAEAVIRRTESSVEGLRGTVEGCLQRMADHTERLLATSEATHSKLLQRFDDQARLLERLAERTDERVGELAETLDGSAEKVRGLVAELGALARGIGEQLQAYQESSLQIRAASRAMEGVSASVAAQVQTSRAVVERLAGLTRTLDDHLGQSHRRVEEFRKVTENLAALSKSLGSNLGRQQAALEAMEGKFDELRAAAERYFHGVTEALSRYLGEFDQSLSEACGQLANLMERLIVPLEDLLETLEGEEGE